MGRTSFGVVFPRKLAFLAILKGGHELWNLFNFTFLVKLSNGSHCITFTGTLLGFNYLERKSHVNVMKRRAGRGQRVSTL